MATGVPGMDIRKIYDSSRYENRKHTTGLYSSTYRRHGMIYNIKRKQYDINFHE